MKSSFSLYIILLILGLGAYLVLSFGSRLESDSAASARRDQSPTGVISSLQPEAPEKSQPRISSVLLDNLRGPLSLLLLQVIVVLITARLLGGLFLKIGQPSVVGEMIAGIILGPSLLGAAFPKALTFLFPMSSLEALRLLSQIGVILFMFIVGMEMNTRRLQEKARAALVISNAGIVVPFFLGITASLFIYRRFAPPGIPFISFALFMGVAMSVTAFPVLARVIEERGMYNTYVGSTAIACAAADDVTAWCILATVIAIVKLNGMGLSVLTVFLAMTFTVFMLRVLKPVLKRLIVTDAEVQKNDNSIVAGALSLAFISACFTEVIGVHALFGAFLAGAIMPTDGALRTLLREKLATFSTVALLPLFFVITGLRTQAMLLNDWQSWLVCVGIIGVAIAGKLGGCTLAARWAGMSWPDSISIGVLMNTRGLMELVALNIGYDLGILSERIFAMMVLMAIVTTCMTGPLLSLIEFVLRINREQPRLAASA